MKEITELEALQNFASSIGLTVHEYTHEDKRRNSTFCVYDGELIVSGKMDYNECNHFFLGWMKAMKQLKKQHHENNNNQQQINPVI